MPLLAPKVKGGLQEEYRQGLFEQAHVASSSAATLTTRLAWQAPRPAGRLGRAVWLGTADALQVWIRAWGHLTRPCMALSVCGCGKVAGCAP